MNETQNLLATTISSCVCLLWQLNNCNNFTSVTTAAQSNYQDSLSSFCLHRYDCIAPLSATQQTPERLVLGQVDWSNPLQPVGPLKLYLTTSELWFGHEQEGKLPKLLSSNSTGYCVAIYSPMPSLIWLRAIWTTNHPPSEFWSVGWVIRPLKLLSPKRPTMRQEVGTLNLAQPTNQPAAACGSLHPGHSWLPVHIRLQLVNCNNNAKSIKL